MFYLAILEEKVLPRYFVRDKKIQSELYKSVSHINPPKYHYLGTQWFTTILVVHKNKHVLFKQPALLD